MAFINRHLWWNPIPRHSKKKGNYHANGLLTLHFHVYCVSSLFATHRMEVRLKDHKTKHSNQCMINCLIFSWLLNKKTTKKKMFSPSRGSLKSQHLASWCWRSVCHRTCTNCVVIRTAGNQTVKVYFVFGYLRAWWSLRPKRSWSRSWRKRRNRRQSTWRKKPLPCRPSACP